MQWKRGELEAAEVTLAQALALWERVLGPMHPDLSATLLGLGEVELARHHVDEAAAYLERARELLERAASDQELLADVRFALARAIVERDPHRALALAEEAAGAQVKEPKRVMIAAFLERHDLKGERP